MKPLVIGWGNTLRSDDGVGRIAARRLAADPRMAGAHVLECHQLTPELAEDVAGASLVVLVDADATDPVGEVRARQITPTAGPAPALSHGLNPGSLLALVQALYGSVPPAYLVTVGIRRREVGPHLTARVRASLPRVADLVAELVGEQRHAHA